MVRRIGVGRMAPGERLTLRVLFHTLKSLHNWLWRPIELMCQGQPGKMSGDDIG
jgi:hypothetical protein